MYTSYTDSHLVIIIIVFIFIKVFTTHLNYTIAKDFYDNRVNQNKTKPKVYDISHNYLPNLSHNKFLRILNEIPVVLPFLLLFVNVNIFIEYIFYMFTIFFIRCIFNLATILPKTDYCKNTDDDNFHILSHFHGHCYDFIFSGHFSSFFLFTLILYNHFNHNIYLLVFSNILYALIILLIRAHYTTDILVAFVITSLVYQNKLSLLPII